MTTRKQKQVQVKVAGRGVFGMHEKPPAADLLPKPCATGHRLGIDQAAERTQRALQVSAARLAWP